MAPLPQAPASCVESDDQSMPIIEPLLSGFMKACVQPVRSHSRRVWNDPTAKVRPFGAHLTDVTMWSCGRDVNSRRPNESQTF